MFKPEVTSGDNTKPCSAGLSELAILITTIVVI